MAQADRAIALDSANINSVEWKAIALLEQLKSDAAGAAPAP